MLDDLDQLDELWNQYCRRRGDTPSLAIEEFARDYPEHADAISDLFPLLEDLKGLDAVAQFPREIAGRKIVRCLGAGGMGVVYEAHCGAPRKRVAVKVIDSLAVGPEQVERFEQEARLAATLHHGNIVPIYDFGRQDGCTYYSMRLVDGVDLSQVLHYDDPRIGSGEPRQQEDLGRTISQHLAENWQHQVQLAVQLCGALQHAHDHGILHRDVKPGNVLIDRDYHVWVSDFGLAKHQFDGSDVTRKSRAVGTPRYMAPEQIRGVATPASDVFGVGIILYEMTLLKHNQPRQRHDIWTGGLENPKKWNPEIPERLQEIILKSVALDPRHRYGTADELAADLKSFQEATGTPSLVEAEPGHSTSQSPVRSKTPSVPLYAAIGLLILLSGSLLLLACTGAAAAKNRNAYGTTGDLEDSSEVETSSDSDVPTFTQPLHLDRRMFQPDGETIVIPSQDAQGVLALQLEGASAGQPANYVISVVGGLERDRIYMTPQGIFTFADTGKTLVSEISGSREYHVQLQIESGSRPCYARLRRGNEDSWQLVVDTIDASTRLSSEVVAEDFPIAPGFIDFATFDGESFYQLAATENGKLSLYETIRSNERWFRRCIEQDCGLVGEINGFAMSGPREFVWIRSSEAISEEIGQQSCRIVQGSLRPGGSIGIAQTDVAVSYCGTIRGFSCLDVGRYQWVREVPEGGAAHCEMLWAGNPVPLPLNDQMTEYRIEQSGMRTPEGASAAWIDRGDHRTSTDAEITLLVQ